MTAVPDRSTRAHAHPPPAAVLYRPDIDGLRGLAVLLVVVFHAFPHALRGGFIGVDVFFVISGFLISSQILSHLTEGSFSFRDFYARRIRRIFPALLVVLAFCLALGWLALLADEYQQLGKHLAAASLFASNFALLGESGYFDNAAETKPLLHLWSLGIEEQFYLIWPVLLWASWRSRVGLTALFLTTGVVSFALNVGLVATDGAAVFYLPQFRFWELALGGALAYRVFTRRQSTAPTAPSLWHQTGSAIGLVAVGLSGLYLTEKLEFPGWWALFPTVGACLIIGSGPEAWVNRNLLGNRWLVRVGLISYPLYLWHWPLLSFLRVTQSQWPQPALAGAAVVVSFALATLTFLLIERPLRFNPRRRLTVSLLLGCMLALGLLGALVAEKNGLSGREHIKGLVNNRDELVRTPRIDDACLQALAVPTLYVDYCRYRDVGARETVAVIGDSHAHVAFPGIAELLATQGVNSLLLANSSCPPLVGTPSAIKAERPGEALNRELQSCSQKIDQIYSALARKPAIKKVFLITRGAIYLTGQGFGEPERNISRSPIVAPAQFEAGLQRTAEWLKREGKDAYFVLENPETGLDPAACIERPLKISTSKCEIDATVVAARQAEYLSIFKRLRHAVVIETLPAFCPDGKCALSRNGRLLYADDDHLSVSGSHFQAQEILRPWLVP